MAKKENPKTFLEKEIKAKIKEYSDQARLVAEEGEKIQSQRNILTQQLAQITNQGRELLAKVKCLQDLLNENTGN